MRMAFIGDTLHEMPKACFLGKIRKYYQFILPSAELAQRLVKVNYKSSSINRMVDIHT